MCNVHEDDKTVTFIYSTKWNPVSRFIYTVAPDKYVQLLRVCMARCLTSKQNKRSKNHPPKTFRYF